MIYPPIASMCKNITRPTNLRQLLRLGDPHSVAPLGIIRAESAFSNMVRDTLLHIDDIVVPSRKGFILTNLKKNSVKHGIPASVG